MSWPCRCRRKACQARQNKRYRPESYTRAPKCRACGKGLLRVDEYRQRAERHNTAAVCRPDRVWLLRISLPAPTRQQVVRREPRTYPANARGTRDMDALNEGLRQLVLGKMIDGVWCERLIGRPMAADCAARALARLTDWITDGPTLMHRAERVGTCTMTTVVTGGGYFMARRL